MKKNILFLFCIIFVSCVSAQTTKLQAIKEKIAEINKKLPIHTDGGMTIEKMKVEKGYVVQYASSPSMFDRDGKSLSRPYGESFLEQAKNEGVRSMYKDYLACGLGAKQIMYFKDTKKTETLTFEVADLERMLAFPASAYRQLIHELRTDRDALPTPVVEGITCIAYEIPHYDFIMVYEADENVYPMDAVEKSLNKTKVKILSELANGESDMLDMFNLCVNAGFGFGMKYIGKSSRKSVEVIISYDELKKCLY